MDLAIDTTTAQEQSTGADGELFVNLTSGIVVSIIMLLLAFFLFAFFLYLKLYWSAIPAFGRPGGARTEPAAGDPRGGLDAAAIEALPSFVFRQRGAVEAIECSVCITEIVDGETARLLTKCGHGFHKECVELWLRSHSTCPVCRCVVVSAPSGNGECVSEARVRPPSSAAAVSGVVSATEGTPVPTANPGSQEGSRADAMLVIEIPRRMTEALP